MMKRIGCLLLTLCLVLALPALAAEDLSNRPLADGVVTAAHFVDVVAPFSGTLTSFDLTSGDAVEAGAELMSFVTTKIYASEAGTIKAVFVKPGDDAAAVTSRYGAALGIEPALEKQVKATTVGAYNDDDNKVLHLGETLYMKSSTATRVEGSGRVVAVSGGSYVLDVLKGDFDLDESLTLYRDDDYDAKSCVGKGTVTRRDSLLTQAAGRVVNVPVQEGNTVAEGQLLLEVVSADADPDVVSATVVAPAKGVIASVAVNPGQQVWKGQLLCRLYLTEALEVTADVDEMDLGALKVGDTLPVTLDVNKANVLTGTVTEISSLGITKQNAAYFTIHVSIPAASARLGASASVYLPEK